MNDHPNTVVKTFYVHGQPYEEEYAPFWPEDDDDRQRRIHYLLYEEAVEVEIDLDTAATRILGFGGKKLVEPTEWR